LEKKQNHTVSCAVGVVFAVTVSGVDIGVKIAVNVGVGQVML
jgi:hypothetical protein